MGLSDHFTCLYCLLTLNFQIMSSEFGVNVMPDKPLEPCT